MEQILTVQEAAKYLRISRAQLYYMIQQKKVPYIRLSERRVVIRSTDLEKWLEKQKQDSNGN